MTEWLKVHGWNPCVGQLTGGSNPPLSAIFIVQSEGRALETGARELRQVREEATVAMFLGLWVARLSPCTIKNGYNTDTMRQYPFIIILGLLGCGGKQSTIRFVHDVPHLGCASPSVMQSAAGGLKQWCEALDGVEAGPYREYFPNREQSVEGAFQEGLRHGVWREWHPNGVRKVEGHYQAGRRTDAWRWWTMDGKVFQEGGYVDGKEYGTWTNYWPTGRKQAEGNYRSGDRIGKWMEWHSNGQRAAEGLYIEGAKGPDWAYWDRSGQRQIR